MILTETWIGFVPEFIRFNLSVLGASNVRSISKSNLSTGEYIPGTENQIYTINNKKMSKHRKMLSSQSRAH
jgi:hypothetical protein